MTAAETAGYLVSEIERTSGEGDTGAMVKYAKRLADAVFGTASEDQRSAAYLVSEIERTAGEGDTGAASKYASRLVHMVRYFA